MAAAVIRKRTRERARNRGAGDRKRRAKVDYFKVNMALSWKENKWEGTPHPMSEVRSCSRVDRRQENPFSLSSDWFDFYSYSCMCSCTLLGKALDGKMLSFSHGFLTGLGAGAQFEGTAQRTQTDWPGSELKQHWRSEHFVYFWKWILIRLLQVDLEAHL